MISRVEALRYRVLRYVSQGIQPFQVLLGPNASGKTTFLDVVGFLGDLLRVGPTRAVLGDVRTGVQQRATHVQQMTWKGEGTSFELAIEMAISPDKLKLLPNGGASACRYEVAVGSQGDSADFGLLAESLWLLPQSSPGVVARQPELFPCSPLSPETILIGTGKKTPQGARKVVNKVADSGNDYFTSETSKWNNLFRLGPTKSALGNLPEDEAKFPIATWVKRTLMEGVQRIALSSDALRRPCPPGETRTYLPDGSNLPWIVEKLEQKYPDRHAAWVDHVRMALPDLESITSRERPEDRHRYLVLRYANGFEAPSWLVSDGTLRLLALTLLAYIPDLEGIYLIEEPENGIHPTAVELLYESISSVYTAQVLCATHSPVILSMAPVEHVLCFGRDQFGATDIVTGNDHPKLKDWKGDVNLGTLFASGVLG